MSETPEPRPGTPASIERRVERLEVEVATLSGSVTRVELNQVHAAELNKLRFDSLDSSIVQVKDLLVPFMKRMEGIIAGEVETVQMRQGREVLADYLAWRKEIDAKVASNRERLDDIGAEIYSPDQRREIEKRLSALETKFIIASGVGTAVLGILYFFGPTLSAMLGGAP